MLRLNLSLVSVKCLFTESCFEDGLLRFYYAKLFDTPEKDRQILGFVNTVLDSDYKDDNILEPKRSLSFFTPPLIHKNIQILLRISGSVKKDKYVFKLGFRFQAFLEIPKMLETHAHKSSIFNTPAKLKYRKL